MAIVQIDKHTFHIPEKGSSCNLWKTFYNQLEKVVGKENAKVVWLNTWGMVGSDTCTTSAEFNSWLKKRDIDVSSAYTRAIADLSAISGGVLGLGKNLMKVLTIGGPILLGGTAIVFLIMTINSSRKMDLGDMANLTPQGNLLKLSKGLKPMRV